ncbi:LysR family transcriptional regulator [Nocardia miyunensis]|uniref:LysR family transcriptional regulator n=1 Tax=Nocardia miyunensis TaxID=282684 RepID=UPI0008304C9E|nr:LysR family transcriptional regulator [Nocardia miyunensis]
MHVDLNLLTALDVLLAERSVGAAADRMHLSQPAMSRTLARLRRVTGDPILVRSGRSMLPTPYAEQIRDELRTLVEQAHAILTPPTDFDAATVQRTFTVQCNDVLANAMAADLLTRIRRDAPGVRIRILGESGGTSDELREGRIDARLTADEPDEPDLRARVVATDHLALIRSDTGTPATLAEFAAIDHVVVSRRGRLRDPIDDILEKHQLSRRVVLSVPTIDVALRAVAAGDLATVAPASFARRAAHPGLSVHPLPFPLPLIRAVLSWHARVDTDPAHHWLREMIATSATASIG